MSKFDTLIQQYAALSYEELLDFAQKSYRDLSELVRPKLSGSNASGAPLTLFAAFLGADGKLTPEEHRFISDLLGLEQTYEDTIKQIRSLNPDECRRKADRLAASLPSAKKASFISLCLCFMAVDHTVSEDEAEFIRKLMS